jgi:hypothetical protein
MKVERIVRPFELNDQVNSLIGHGLVFVYRQGSFRMIERKLKMNLYVCVHVCMLVVIAQLITMLAI